MVEMVVVVFIGIMVNSNIDVPLIAHSVHAQRSYKQTPG